MYDNNNNNNISQYTSNYSTISNNNTNNNNYNIKVCIRLRPLLPHEDIEYWTVNKEQNTISTTSQNKIIDNIYQSQSFSFDKIYLSSSNSQIIYIENCQNITINLLKGINGSIFTYGQTTSGKTFTMLGTPESPGILPCVLKDIFDRISNNNSNVNTNENDDINNNNNINTEEYDSNIIHNNNRYSIYITYIEIYNEVIHDLLSDKSNLKLVDDQNYNGVIVSEAEKIYIKSFEEGIKLKDYGEENRKYRDTLINEYSSRSHTIFQIFVKQKKNINNNINNNDNESGEIYSTLNLIDLAGSEKINSKINSKTETGNINKSLFVLANVINKLAERNNTNNSNIHIPYRDSKLTRLLSNCLGGNSLITMIINISPSANNYFQTLSSLRFASRAKTVKLKPKVNEKFSDKELLMIYKKQIEKYKKMIKNNNNNNENGINNKNSIYNSNNVYNSNSIYNTSAFNSIYNENNNNNNEYYENGSINKDEYNNDNNNNDINNDDYKMKYFRQVIENKRLKLENKNLIKENENLRYLTINSSTPRLPSTLNENYDNNNNNNENNFVSQFKNQIVNMIRNSHNNNNNNYKDEILNNLNQIEIEYQKQLETLQQFYLSKIKNIQDKIINNNNNNNNNYISNNSIQMTDFSNNNNINNNNEINDNNNNINNNLDYLDEIDTNISNNNNNIQSVKNEYEIKENLISKLFKEYINEIEEYYNNIIKMNPEKSKEINIEYNNKLNYIKNLYDFKQNELETNFFNKLKTITYNNNNNNK